MRLRTFTALVAFLLAAPTAHGFNISGPSEDNNATVGGLKAATDPPPFQHWDLREFPDCKVPWSAHDGTADVGTEFDAVESAFSEWEDVENAIIAFRKEPLPAGAQCPLLLDGNNSIGWDGGDCGTPSDDYWDAAIPAPQRVCGGAVAAGGTIVHAGPDGWLLSEAIGCFDDVRATIIATGQLVVADKLTGGNGIIETFPTGDDVWDPGIPPAQQRCFGAVAAGGVIVRDGGDGQITPAKNCSDDSIDGFGNVVDGGDGRIDSLLDDGSLAATTLGITAVFDETSSGKIVEADILFNDDETWSITADGAPMGGNPDVWTVAMHEIGHFLGIHHSSGGWANDGPIMDARLDTTLDANHVLGDDDEDALNWQYTPDLGDAPDPDAAFNKYQSRVHGGTPSRRLNGVLLRKPAKGAAHLFGYPGKDPANTEFQFEWLGASMDNHPKECEARMTDADKEDDGVTLPDLLTRGAANRIEILVSTSGVAGRYDATDTKKMLYVHGYMDFDNDREFEFWDDRVLYWIGTPEPKVGFPDECTKVEASANFVPPAEKVGDSCKLKFDVDVPGDTPVDDFYCRFRLDYGEGEGFIQNFSGDLDNAVGAAQFGEVEDYRCELPALPHQFALDFELIRSDLANNAVPLSTPAVAGAIVSNPKFTHTPFSGSLTGADLRIEGNLGTGTLASLLGTGALTQATLPARGTLRLCLLNPDCGMNVAVPLTVNESKGVGIGGTVIAYISTLGMRISIEGAPWTNGVTSAESVITSSSGIGNLFDSGDTRTPFSGTLTVGGTGTAKLVTPIVVRTNLANHAVGGFATLNIRFAPEPGLLVLLGAGLVGLAVLGRARMKP